MVDKYKSERKKLRYSTLDIVSQVSLLKFSYVTTSLKNTLPFHEKKST